MHTAEVITCPISGFEALEIAVDVLMTVERLNRLFERGVLAPAVTDFPNWDAAAGACGLYEMDDDGNLSDRILPKPTFPLTSDFTTKIPLLFSRYLTSNRPLDEALKQHERTYYPNSLGD